MTKEQEFLKEFEAWVNTQIMVNEMAVEESRRVLKKIRMSVLRMHIFVMRASWMPIALFKGNLPTTTLIKDFMIYQMNCLVNGITKERI